MLVRASWHAGGPRDAAVDAAVGDLIELVRGLRNLRSETGIAAGAWRHLIVAAAGESSATTLGAGRRYLEALARGRPVEILPPGAAAQRPAAVVASSLGAAWYPSDDDGPDGPARREAQAVHLRRGIDRLRQLLANPAFTDRAPAEVVGRERDRLAELEAQLRQLDD